MSYEVVDTIGLPVLEERVVHSMSDGKEIKDKMASGETIRKEPGETVTLAELKKAGQTQEQIASL
jgi:hypothetical protein